MAKETEEYGFIARRDGRGDVKIFDGMGGGEDLTATNGSALRDEIEEFIASRAPLYAELIVEELDNGKESEDE